MLRALCVMQLPSRCWVYISSGSPLCVAGLSCWVSPSGSNNTVSVPRFEFLQRDFGSVWLVGRLLVGTETVVKSAACLLQLFESEILDALNAGNTVATRCQLICTV